ncbi:MAG: ComEA family DNA-binding protein [Chloroflexi bacterium]|nr:ComEA family DNA-binding protein [Chloroflexota bacterium]
MSSGGERIFHTPDSAYYARTEIDESKGEVWFCTEEDALSAGWRPPSSKADGSATPTPTAVEPHSININLASAVELEMLPGIGEVKARAIVEYRVLNGPFSSVEELLEVKGIGPATLDKVRDLITIE